MAKIEEKPCPEINGCCPLIHNGSIKEAGNSALEIHMLIHEFKFFHVNIVINAGKMKGFSNVNYIK